MLYKTEEGKIYLGVALWQYVGTGGAQGGGINERESELRD